MQLQFTRTQLYTFLALLFVSDTILVALIVGTSVSPAMGAVAGLACIGLPVLLFVVFVPMIAGAMGELTIGDPASAASDLGPLIDAEALAQRLRALTIPGAPLRVLGVDGAQRITATFAAPSQEVEVKTQY